MLSSIKRKNKCVRVLYMKLLLLLLLAAAVSLVDGYEIVDVYNRQDKVVQSALLCITISLVYVAFVSIIVTARASYFSR